MRVYEYVVCVMCMYDDERRLGFGDYPVHGQSSVCGGWILLGYVGLVGLRLYSVMIDCSVALAVDVVLYCTEKRGMSRVEEARGWARVHLRVIEKRNLPLWF